MRLLSASSERWFLSALAVWSATLPVSGLTFANIMQEPIKTSVRTRLIEAAATLAHRRGFGNTRLADIAREAKVPAGNLYYYFKAKEEIGESIVERTLSELQTAK